jgi:hypothetical protein
LDDFKSQVRNPKYQIEGVTQATANGGLPVQFRISALSPPRACGSQRRMKIAREQALTAIFEGDLKSSNFTIPLQEYSDVSSMLMP